MSSAPTDALAATPHVLGRKCAGTALLAPCLKWATLGVVARVLLLFGPRTPLGPALVGLIFPLLVLEARITTRHHWRMRLFNTIAFAVPSCTLLIFGSVFPSSCCFCDHGPAAKVLRTLEMIAEFLLFNSMAILPAVVLLAALHRTAASPREKTAHSVATMQTLFATVTATLPFLALFYALSLLQP